MAYVCVSTVTVIRDYVYFKTVRYILISSQHKNFGNIATPSRYFLVLIYRYTAEVSRLFCLQQFHVDKLSD